MQSAPSYVMMSYDLFLLFLNDDCLRPQYVCRYNEHRKFQSYFSRSLAGFAFHFLLFNHNCWFSTKYDSFAVIFSRRKFHEPLRIIQLCKCRTDGDTCQTRTSSVQLSNLVFVRSYEVDFSLGALHSRILRTIN